MSSLGVQLRRYLLLAALFLALLALGSCQVSDEEHDHPGSTIALRLVLEPTDAIYASTATEVVECRCINLEITSCQHNDGKLRLGPIRYLQLAQTWKTIDSLGYPAVGFDVSESDREAIREWTATRAGRQILMMIDGVVQWSPIFDGPLDGRSIVGGRYSEAELEELVSTLSTEK